ncbi:OmpA family protein [Akkermansiaceae bacterium]|nr:OmpA family protein [Akkermansiaceae bacterium]
MQDDYSWKGGEVSSSTYYRPKSEGAGVWMLIAVIFALLLHAAAIWGFSRMDFGVAGNEEETVSPPEIVRIQRMVFDEAVPEIIEPPAPMIVEQEPVEIEPPADEIDMLEQVVDIDIDILPNVEMMEVPMSAPVLAGAFEEETFEPMQAPVFDPETPKMGLTDDLLPQSDGGELIVDPGARMAEEYDPDQYTESLRKGSEGSSDDGLFKEFTSLDTMTQMNGNALLASKALIGSDLLFDFGSSELRQSARVSLMKVALLIDRNPELVCWVDGHTDLIGKDDRNLTLSQERAMAVKSWLVDTLALSPERVAVSGYGKTKPLILSGTADEQAANRRVEIKMRKGRPENEALLIEKTPKEEVLEKPAPAPTPAPTPVPETIPVDENKAVIVKPKISKSEALENLELPALPEFIDIDRIPLNDEPAIEVNEPEALKSDSLDLPELRQLPTFQKIPAIPLSEEEPLAIDDLPLAIPVEE